MDTYLAESLGAHLQRRYPNIQFRIYPSNEHRYASIVTTYNDCHVASLIFLEGFVLINLSSMMMHNEYKGTPTQVRIDHATIDWYAQINEALRRVL